MRPSYKNSFSKLHYVKSVCIRSFSGTYFPEFGLITDLKNSEYNHFSRSVSSFACYQFDENISGSQNLEFVLLKFPCKHTTCIPRWNDVATVVSTVFQRENHVVCLHSGIVIILVRLVFNKGGWSCNPFQVNFPS